MRKLSWCTLFFSLLLACSSREKATRIYYHGNIWTGDSSLPRASAIALRDSEIIYVGEDYASYQGKSTEMIDLQGKMVVPGFTDNHTHFLSGGFQLGNINLRNLQSRQGFIDAIHSYILTLRDDRWILGGDWDHEAWGGLLPARQWIDSVSGNHPVFVSRYDGHMALANSLALKQAGITRETPDPPGGQIVREPRTGEPTGVLRDEAMDLVFRVIPAPSEDALQEFLLRGEHYAFEHGVTQVHDMGSYGGWTDLETYRKAHAKNELELRIYSFVPVSTWNRMDSFVAQHGRGDDRLHWGGLKGFVDGSLGSTTAWFYQPYLDAPKSTGLQVTDTNLLRQWILDADAAGLQVATHAIGDRANDWILDVYSEADRKNGHKDRRFRVEHAQHLTEKAIVSFGTMHVIPSMQPFHAIDDGKWAYKRLDSGRLKRTYAFKSLLDHGAMLTFGSDWTVAPLDPIAGIYAAVTRRTLDDKNPDGWYPDEKITVEQALTCYTLHNAYAGFQEKKLGMLKAGMLADLAVLSGDLFSVAPEKIRSIRVIRTVVNGKEVFRAPDQ